MQPLDAVAVLSALASDQFGLVTSAQARKHGVGGVMLRRLLDASVLLPVARGLYRAAAAPEPAHLEIIVAWLRLDPARAAWRRDGRGRDDAVVSHSSACVLIGLGELRGTPASSRPYRAAAARSIPRSACTCASDRSNPTT